jgi:hypothetical protein
MNRLNDSTNKLFYIIERGTRLISSFTSNESSNKFGIRVACDFIMKLVTCNS